MSRSAKARQAYPDPDKLRREREELKQRPYKVNLPASIIDETVRRVGDAGPRVMIPGSKPPEPYKSRLCIEPLEPVMPVLTPAELQASYAANMEIIHTKFAEIEKRLNSLELAITKMTEIERRLDSMEVQLQALTKKELL